MNHARKILTIVGVASLVATVGCKEDPPTPKLFEEEGAWSLIRYDLVGDGDISMVNTATRDNAFMLRFDSENNVVTTGACVNEGEGQFTPADSSCRASPTETSWQCRCFAYAFENEKMLWREFDAGAVVPEVSFDTADDGSNTPAPGGTGTGGTGGGTADAGGDGADAGADAGDGGSADGNFEVNVAEVNGLAGAYNFLPLPAGVFGSNGTSSRFIFQTKSPLLFDQVFEDPDGRPGCTPCI